MQIFNNYWVIIKIPICLYYASKVNYYVYTYIEYYDVNNIPTIYIQKKKINKCRNYNNYERT